MMTEVLIACQNELQAKEAFGKRSKTKESCCAGMKAATRHKGGKKGDAKQLGYKSSLVKFMLTWYPNFITLLASF